MEREHTRAGAPVTVRRIAIASLVLVAASLLFHLFQKQISARWMAVPTHPELFAVLDDVIKDERALARLEPERQAEHRQRFERAEQLRKRLEILQLNRDEVTRRYELILWAIFLGVALVVAVLYLLGLRRQEARLNQLKGFLEALASGKGDIHTGERRHDTIGRIAGMIEETSRVVARDRNRLKSLEHLASWQEAARRHAHEIRTPLTAAQMEAERLADLVRSSGGEKSAELQSAVLSILEELERLRRFTREFTSFARIGQPQFQEIDLKALVADFCKTFGNAWPGMCLAFEPPMASLKIWADPEMIRQVLANLCTNSALALNGTSGAMRFETFPEKENIYLRAADDGPGIAAEILPRLFEPYATTRKIGEGMGLGLAISRKILLDHQGDLRLETTSSAGTAFRLVFPVPQRGEP
jgi:two-component system nitrogen regulation sensor histidine kinase NtrY